MLEGKATIQDTNMPLKLQLQAIASTSEALNLFDCRSIAARIKKEFDMIYGPSWQCVVGSSFSCFFTHMQGTFIYFNLESLKFLNFKGVAA